MVAYISMMKRGTVAQPFDHIIETLVAVAKKHGFVIYAVGGFVRDLYAGRDVDGHFARGWQCWHK